MSAPPTPEAPDGRRSHRRARWTDAALALIIFAGAGWWATSYWYAFIGRGGSPEFYQSYFEPAVMVACGKGFVVSDGPRPEALEDFLQQRRDEFECADLPASLPLGTQNLYQSAWVYLLVTVGVAWWVLGVSWSGMGPLVGLFFGLSTALVYGILRLGMGRLLAVVGASGLTVSAAQLLNLPNFRDYAKAPFTLALILLIGLLVAGPVTWRRVLALSGAAGMVLGVGYGFRTDFLVLLPVCPVVLWLFLEGGVVRHWRLKAVATALFVLVFVLASWPVWNSVRQQGGCQWHVAILGLQSPFDGPLAVAPAPYDFGYAYSDGFVYWTIRGYAQRLHPADPPPAYCSAEYDQRGGEYFRAIAATFPADLLVRAYGSVTQVAELPFLWWASPLVSWFDGLYDARATLLRPQIGVGVFIVMTAVLMAGAASWRVGAFLLFFVMYFGGYPAVQFQTRHHFHLEFITWWAAGFILQQAAHAAWTVSRRGWSWPGNTGRVTRGVAFGAVSGLLIVGVLAAARWHQQGQAVSLFTTYGHADKVPLNEDGTLPDSPDRIWPAMLEVHLNGEACQPGGAVTFRYRMTPADGDLTRTYQLPEDAWGRAQTSRVFFPAYELFDRVEVPDAPPGCLEGAYAFTDTSTLPLLLGAVLPPDWTSQPLYQRLVSRE